MMNPSMTNVPFFTEYFINENIMLNPICHSNGELVIAAYPVLVNEAWNGAACNSNVYHHQASSVLSSHDSYSHTRNNNNYNNDNISFACESYTPSVHHSHHARPFKVNKVILSHLLNSLNLWIIVLQEIFWSC